MEPENLLKPPKFPSFGGVSKNSDEFFDGVVNYKKYKKWTSLIKIRY